MINTINTAKKYIGKDYEKVPYLYNNLYNYSKEDPNIHVWIERDSSDAIISVCLLYHTCLHFYSHLDTYNGNLLWDILEKFHINIIMLPDSQAKLHEQFDDMKWHLVTDYIIKHDRSIYDPNYIDYIIESENEIPAITDLLLSDSMYKKIYTYNDLYQQLLDRYNAGYGKIFRIKDDNEITGCVAITGENDRFIFDGCLIVKSSARGTGIAEKLMKALLSYTNDKKKDCLCFIGIDNLSSLKMHKKFENPMVVGKILKFIKND